MKETYKKIRTSIDVPLAVNMLSIRTVDMHTGGEPLRVIVEGFPELSGSSILEYRRDCELRYDNLRRALMHEPRGHADMYGCILTPAQRSDSNFGIIFLHTEGYSTMCGHAIIAITKLAAVMKWVNILEGENILKIDAPCGQITSFFSYVDGEISGIRFHCVPSFVVGLDLKVSLPDLGEVVYDLAYGGAYYAYVDMAKNNFDFDLSVDSYRELIDTGMRIKHAVMSSDVVISHPVEEELSFLYGTIFIDNVQQESGSDSRNVCIFADGELDRSPTGSGVSGRMAIHHVRGDLEAGQHTKIESIIGSVFTGSIVEVRDFGEYTAVIPEVSGESYIMAENQFLLDPDDPFRYGFLLR